jgi:hypothetical protein
MELIVCHGMDSLGRYRKTLQENCEAKKESKLEGRKYFTGTENDRK